MIFKFKSKSPRKTIGSPTPIAATSTAPPDPAPPPSSSSALKTSPEAITRAILSGALAKANDAVRADQESDQDYAVNAYMASCELLTQALNRTQISSAEWQRIRSIRANYYTRAADLKRNKYLSTSSYSSSSSFASGSAHPPHTQRQHHHPPQPLQHYNNNQHQTSNMYHHSRSSSTSRSRASPAPASPSLPTLQPTTYHPPSQYQHP